MNGFSFNSGQRKKIVETLLRWFENNKRDLPWRKTKDPYKIWISEMMLQQTRVEQVIPYYQRFLKRFPNIEYLAESRLDDVLRVWQGMGYYRRARYIHEGARTIVNKFHGKIPNTYEELRLLPGFGPYTCGSVLSIAYNLPYPAVDGNVIRFISRLLRIESETNTTSTRREIEKIVREMMPAQHPSRFSQALMEMGATVCKPVQPACYICCCRKACRAYNELPNPSVLPNKTKVVKGPHLHIAAGIVRKGDTVLISRRPENVILGNLWEFPGGKKESKESLEQTCTRELKEKIGITVKTRKPFITVKHHYSHYSITIHFFNCKYVKGKIKKTGVRWVKIAKLEKYVFSKVHKQVAVQIMGSD